MAGTFEIYEDRAGKFRFRLKASSGQIIAAGEAYDTKEQAIQAVRAVQAAALEAALVEAPDVSIA